MHRDAVSAQRDMHQAQTIHWQYYVTWDKLIIMHSRCQHSTSSPCPRIPWSCKPGAPGTLRAAIWASSASARDDDESLTTHDVCRRSRGLNLLQHGVLCIPARWHTLHHTSVRCLRREKRGRTVLARPPPEFAGATTRKRSTATPTLRGHRMAIENSRECRLLVTRAQPAAFKMRS
jgi:hypothetical protein